MKRSVKRGDYQLRRTSSSPLPFPPPTLQPSHSLWETFVRRNVNLLVFFFFSQRIWLGRKKYSRSEHRSVCQNKSPHGTLGQVPGGGLVPDPTTERSCGPGRELTSSREACSCLWVPGVWWIALLGQWVWINLPMNAGREFMSLARWHKVLTTIELDHSPTHHLLPSSSHHSDLLLRHQPLRHWPWWNKMPLEKRRKN